MLGRVGRKRNRSELLRPRRFGRGQPVLNKRFRQAARQTERWSRKLNIIGASMRFGAVVWPRQKRHRRGKTFWRNRYHLRADLRWNAAASHWSRSDQPRPCTCRSLRKTGTIKLKDKVRWRDHKWNAVWEAMVFTPNWSNRTHKALRWLFDYRCRQELGQAKVGDTEDWLPTCHYAARLPSSIQLGIFAADLVRGATTRRFQRRFGVYQQLNDARQNPPEFPSIGLLASVAAFRPVAPVKRAGTLEARNDGFDTTAPTWWLPPVVLKKREKSQVEIVQPPDYRQHRNHNLSTITAH